jgi:diguanylate cyclase (GGDEF)-like protein
VTVRLAATASPTQAHPSVPAGVASRHSRRLWIGYLAVGTAAIAGYQLLVAGTAVRDVVYLVLGLVCVAAIIVGVRIHGPEQRGPWYLMALGQLLWVVGDGIYSLLEDALHEAPSPSLADLFYLAAYPVLAWGIGALIRARRSHLDRAALVDSLIVTAGLGLLSWVVLAGPTIAESRDSPWVAAVSAAYPVGDVLLIAVLVMLMVTPGGRTTAMRLLLGAIILLIVADSLYLALSLFGSGASYPIDWLWLASYLVWGAAALHPSMAATAGPHADVDVRFRRARLVAMTAAALVAPAILAIERLVGTPLDVWAVVIGAVGIVLLVVIRMKLGIDQVTSVNTQLELLRDELAFQAAHDSLTDLPNRAQAMRQIHAALSRAQRSGDLVAMLFIDLDGFKAVNDTHGHRAGDQVLREVAHRLRRELRAGDTAARLGGDEFVVLLDPVDSAPAAVEAGRRIIAAVSRPIRIGERTEAAVGASIGVAFNDDRGTDADALLHEADTAAYRAKAGGRGRVEVFSPALVAELDRRTEIAAALAGAIEHDELVVHYQPIIDLRDGEVEGYEALVRWNRPGEGMLPPDEFIPVAEGSDLICDLDTWVLHQAARQLQAWNRDPASRRMLMAVNISGRHLNTPRIRGDVAAVLAAYDIEPGQLVLEITETVLVDDGPGLETLHELRRQGISLSLDDFGTGYSTVAQMSRLPIDTVKIDRRYLDTGTATARRLFELMVRAAHALDLRVVAEGVEHQDQLDLLLELQIESAQGYLLGAPMTSAELEGIRGAGAF